MLSWDKPPSRTSNRDGSTVRLGVEALEDRTVPTVTASVIGTTLTVTGGPENDRIAINPDPTTLSNLIVTSYGSVVGVFPAAGVTDIAVNSGDGNDTVYINPVIFLPATITGGKGSDVFVAGGGPTVLNGGTGNNTLIGGAGMDTLNGGPGNDTLYSGAGASTLVPGTGKDKLFNLKTTDTVVGASPRTKVFANPFADTVVLTAGEVTQLIDRAAAASASTDAIIAVVDRNGRILGVRVENGVSATVVGDPATLTFAIDGALAVARTAALFASDAAPLTSRTIEALSQSTITQREVESTPDNFNPASTARGPGFVAPIGLGGHFPGGHRAHAAGRFVRHRTYQSRQHCESEYR
jgi:Ca2+-binding RTX toxin-like protein